VTRGWFEGRLGGGKEVNKHDNTRNESGMSHVKLNIETARSFSAVWGSSVGCWVNFRKLLEIKGECIGNKGYNDNISTIIA
jgi:hypothetical protein